MWGYFARERVLASSTWRRLGRRQSRCTRALQASERPSPQMRAANASIRCDLCEDSGGISKRLADGGEALATGPCDRTASAPADSIKRHDDEPYLRRGSAPWAVVWGIVLPHAGAHAPWAAASIVASARPSFLRERERLSVVDGARLGHRHGESTQSLLLHSRRQKRAAPGRPRAQDLRGASFVLSASRGPARRRRLAGSARPVWGGRWSRGGVGDQARGRGRKGGRRRRDERRGD